MSVYVLLLFFVDIRLFLGLSLLVMQATLAVVYARELYAARRRDIGTKSVAVLSELMWIVAATGWVWYGVWSHSAVLVASGSIGVIGSATVAWLVFNTLSQHQRRRYVMITAVFALAMILSAAVWGLGGLGTFLAVFGLVQFLPQMHLSATQLLRGEIVHSVPLKGAALRALYTGLWAIYAVAWHLWGTDPVPIDWPLAVWGLAGYIAFSLQVCVGLSSRRMLQRSFVVPEKTTV